MKKILFTMSLVAMASICINAQVKIGDNPGTINSNSLLELESTNKGFLPPRVILNSISSVSPLTGTVTAGMLVYSLGGTLTDGYYYWNSTEWKKLDNGTNNVVTKTATTTLTKTETIVLASNNITLTLPVITATDNGLEITIKNIGIHTDLVTVIGSASVTIDGIVNSTLTKYKGETFVATAGYWIIRGTKFQDHVLDIDDNGSWTTIQEAVDFLNMHMSAPTIVKLADANYNINSTITINLPYPVTFQGLSFGHSTLAAASGLANKPMFRCATECYFKMIMFEATTLTNYGTLAGEDAIRLVGNGTYHEIKDCTFNRFYTTILDSTDAELWLFECDISNATSNGILIHGGVSGVKIRVAETDFISCKRGINMSKATLATIQLVSGAYMNLNTTDTAIVYRPSTFTSFTTMSITGNSWNSIGKYIEGFDFTRSDSRDANAIVLSNAGLGDKKPSCYINLLNGGTTTSLGSANTWNKVSWTNTSSSTCKFTIGNNKITYQPLNSRDAVMVITGNLSVNNSNKTISLGIVKNGSSTIRYGETTLRTGASGTSSQFSTVIYITGVVLTDYFEVYCSSSSSSDIITMLDLNWQVSTN